MTQPQMNVVELANDFRSGQLSIVSYISDLERYFNQREPSIQSFVPEEGRFDRLRRQAEELLVRFPNPDTRPSLFGIPVGVKDIFQVEGFTTHAGSKLPTDELQGEEAHSVTCLKQAGALVMGKTITTEFAYFGPGPTRNPHNLNHTPGGSSSGSAASVGAGLCPLALGTQTIGSVIRPASFCGCVGYKPTYDRISREGVIPLSPTFDHIGVFTATVAGAALAASVLLADWNSASTGSAEKPVLGIPEGPYLEKASPEMLAHFRDICIKLSEAGYRVKSVAMMPNFADIRERHLIITAGDAARVHRNWFPRYRELYHPKTVELLERGQDVTDEVLNDLRMRCNAFRSGLTMAMEAEGIDLWIAPSAIGPAPEGLDSTGDPIMNLPWTQVGFPALSIPSGQSANSLPLGLQLAGGWGADESLFEWGRAIEQVLTEGQ